jgi:ParB family transcriptional regulator, chromosome partitioning protein
VSKKDLPYTEIKKPVNLLFGGQIITETPKQLNATLSIAQIKLPPSQPRRYFDSQKLDELSRSITKLGIIEPLLVRPLVGNEYELVAGERRLRAAQLAGLTEVPVFIREMDDNITTQVRLVENLQREDLNPIEETEGILELLVLHLDLTWDETIGYLTKMRNVCDRYDEESELRHNVMSQPQTQIIEELFSWLGKMNWQSFVKNRLPLLNLPDDLLGVLRSGQLEYTKAQAISKIKSETERMTLLNDTIHNNLSLAQINQQVKTLKKSPEQQQKNLNQQQSLQFRYKEVSSRLQKSPIWENPKKQKSLEKLLAQIEALIENS